MQPKPGWIKYLICNKVYKITKIEINGDNDYFNFKYSEQKLKTKTKQKKKGLIPYLETQF